MRKARAFTLIELMVVVAILGLLISILLPAMGQAREAANAAKCLANMRNMGLATMLYANDNDEQLPTAGLSHGGHNVDEQGSWLHLLEPYCGDQLLYRCPSDHSIHFDIPLQEGGRLRQVSYATNYYLDPEFASASPQYRGLNVLSRIKRPAKVVFICELVEAGEFAAADHIHANQWIIDPVNKPAEQVATERHSGRSNYAFLDGHAETLSLHEVYQFDSANSSPGNLKWVENVFDPLVAK